MNIELINADKHKVELRIDSLTIAEIMRSYLYNVGVDFAAWKREHFSKPLVFSIEYNEGTVKKIVSEAVIAIKKDCNKILDTIKK